MDDMLASQAAQFKDLAKELKLGDDKSDEDEDPDMADLKKEMKRQGKRFHINHELYREASKTGG
jgi:hypothetical protein